MAETKANWDAESKKTAALMAALFLSSEGSATKAALAVTAGASLALMGELSSRNAFAEPDAYAFLNVDGYRAIRTQGLSLERNLESELETRRRNVRSRLAGLLAGLGFNALFGSPSGRQSEPAARAQDTLSASAAASAFVNGWTKAHVLALQAGTKTKFGDARKVLDSKIKTTVTYEIGSALAEEVRRLLAIARLEGKSVELIWSAVLDERTCGACGDLDGSIVTTRFPPLHPRCRCMVVPRLL